MDTITISEAARRLGVSHHTVGKWVSAGLIKAKAFPGGRKRVRVDEVERFYYSLPDVEISEVLEVREVPKAIH